MNGSVTKTQPTFDEETTVFFQVSKMYNWKTVALRTEKVYSVALASACSAALAHRLGRLLACGPIFGLLAVLFASLDLLWFRIVQWLDPEEEIDRAPTLGRLRGK
jgi:hypothetical protein